MKIIARPLLTSSLSLAALLSLSACGLFGDDQVDEHATGQAAEKQVAAATNDELVKPVTEQIGTPMEERVATLGFLNKRNGLTRDLELKPGQSIRIGRAIVRLRACERTAPWELTPEQGAFVQLLVNDRPSTRQGKDQWKQVFSGWLFRESPSLNVVEHPIYDVWVKRCAMSFPGEEGEPDDASNPTAPRSSASNAANRISSAENEGAVSSTGDEASSSVPDASPTPLTPPRPNINSAGSPAAERSTPAARPAPAPAARPAPPRPRPAPSDDPIGDLISENTGE